MNFAKAPGSNETSPRKGLETADSKLNRIFERLRKNPRTKLTEILRVDERTSNYMGSSDIANSRVNENIEV